MPALAPAAPAAKAAGFPQPVADALIASVENILGTICGSKPTRRDAAEPDDRPCITAVLSFEGTPAWTVSCRMTDAVAPPFMKQFAGFDLPFDSPDMGDAVGEFVNVLAGEVISQLDRRRMKHRMSLPTVLRGSGIEMMPESGAQSRVIDFDTPLGRLHFTMFLPKGPSQMRMPGV